jgi:hypothetical protein
VLGRLPPTMVRPRNCCRCLRDGVATGRLITARTPRQNYSFGLSPRNLAMNSNQVEKPIAARTSPPIIPALEMKMANK